MPVEFTVTPTAGGDVGHIEASMPWTAAGDSLVIWYAWTPTAGAYTLTAVIDPRHEHALGESPAEQANNKRSIQVTVPESAAPPRPPGTTPTSRGSNQATATLNPAVSGFPATVVSGRNPQGRCTAQAVVEASSIHVSLTPPSSLPKDFTFCTIDALLFRGVRLRNGWTVTAVHVGVAPGTARSPTITPEIEGGSSLEMHMRDSITAGAYGKLDVHIAVAMQGPPGTTPFGPSVATTLTSASSRLKMLRVVRRLP